MQFFKIYLNKCAFYLITHLPVFVLKSRLFVKTMMFFSCESFLYKLVLDCDDIELFKLYSDMSGTFDRLSKAHIWVDAARKGNIELFKYIDTLKNTDEYDNHISATREAAAHGHIDIIKYMFDKYPEHSVDGIWESAMRYGHIDICEWLFEHGHVSCINGSMCVNYDGKSIIFNSPIMQMFNDPIYIYSASDAYRKEYEIKILSTLKWLESKGFNMFSACDMVLSHGNMQHEPIKQTPDVSEINDLILLDDLKNYLGTMNYSVDTQNN